MNVNNILHRQAQWDSKGAAVLHVAGGARSDRQAEEPLCSRDQWQRTYSPGKFLSNIINNYIVSLFADKFIIYFVFFYSMNILQILFSMDIPKFDLLFKYL